MQIWKHSIFMPILIGLDIWNGYQMAIVILANNSQIGIAFALWHYKFCNDSSKIR